MTDYMYRSSEVIRIVRLVRPLPLVCEFYALRYTIELYDPPQNSGRNFIVGRLWDEPIGEARILHTLGEATARKQLREGVQLDVGSIADVIFLRLIRQGDAEELAGPHCCFEFVKSPEFRARIEVFRRSG